MVDTHVPVLAYFLASRPRGGKSSGVRKADLSRVLRHPPTPCGVSGLKRSQNVLRKGAEVTGFLHPAPFSQLLSGESEDLFGKSLTSGSAFQKSKNWNGVSKGNLKRSRRLLVDPTFQEKHPTLRTNVFLVGRPWKWASRPLVQA